MSESNGAVSRSTYRADIDGLRAIAVLAVVAYHAFPHVLPSGFIGVDVFFVISGFLISGILLEHIESESFRISNFYARRVRRIFPALLLVMSVGLIIGWLTLFPGEYVQLGEHVVGGSGFFSNFLLWREAGYFDVAAESKPLLHLWSLAIEEQFYIVWPLLLFASWKWRLRAIHFIVLFSLASFTVSAHLAGSDQTAAFYSPVSRFWELMVGGALAYFSRTSIRSSLFYDNVFSVTGMLLLASGLALIDKGRAIPGWWALLPTLGAAFLIAAGPTAWLNRMVVSQRVLVWFGLISYPLYLWHWVIFSYTRIMYGGELKPIQATVAIIVAVGLSWCTYRLLEVPIRHGRYGSIKVAALMTAMVAVAGFGHFVASTSGLVERAVISANPALDSGWAGGDQGMTINDCRIDVPEQRELIANCLRDSRQTERCALLGDSKAAALFGGLVRTSEESGRWLFIGGNGPHGAPLPVLSDAEMYRYYQAPATVAIDAIANNQNIESVVLVAATRALFQLDSDNSIEGLATSPNYELARDGLNHAVQRLIAAGKHVVLLVDNPTLADPKHCLQRVSGSDLMNKVLSFGHENEKCVITIERQIALSERYRQLLDEVVSTAPRQIEVFDTMPYLCNETRGTCPSREGGHFLCSYTDHISDFAAGRIGVALNAHLAAADDLRQSGSERSDTPASIVAAAMASTQYPPSSSAQ